MTEGRKERESREGKQPLLSIPSSFRHGSRALTTASLTSYSEWLPTRATPTSPSEPAAAAAQPRCLLERCSAERTPPGSQSSSSGSPSPV